MSLYSFVRGASRQRIRRKISAYGSLASSWFPNGSDPTPFGWLGDAGCQTDHDSGLVLMGYRYYDTRTGSFITQDPAGDGDNWYAYCDNNPVNEDDPLGLVCAPFESTGMSFFQIYDHVTANGGLPGEDYETVDASGNVIYQFTVSGNNDLGTLGGVTMHIPYGEDISRNIAVARQFMTSSASYSPYSRSKNGYGPTILRHDPRKIKAWLVAHVADGNIWDYKLRTKDKQRYDEFGHVVYAAVSSELRIDLTTIKAGQEYVHEENHPFTWPEGTSGEVLGYNYDQNNYHPGPPLYGIGDMAP